MELVLVVLWACVGCYVGYLVGTKVDNENQGAILGLLLGPIGWLISLLE